MPRSRRHPGSKKPADRRAAILDAALTEFAKHGFAGTSTNAIAARAHVAKGLVFHHFASKEALYVAVVEEVLGLFLKRFASFLEHPPPDLFERVLGWSQIKLELVHEDPRRLRVMVDALFHTPDKLRSEVWARSDARAGPGRAALFDGIDATRLRPGVSQKDATDAALLLTAGFERVIMPLLSSRADSGAGILDELMAQTRRMFELLRDGVYRQKE